MSKERISMQKIRDILRLRFNHQLSPRKIARSLKSSRGAVLRCLQRFSASDLSWPLPDSLTDVQLEKQLYERKSPFATQTADEHFPDWEYIRTELARDGVTLKLLWEEYRQARADGLMYSQFCERYKRYRSSISIAFKNHYKGGEMSFVDYSGKSISIVNRFTGEVVKTAFFLWTWGASNLTYFDFTLGQKVEELIGSHNRGLEYFGCVPHVTCPDNPKTMVSKACRYEPELNYNYQRFAEHYGTAVVPARVRKPKDKAKVESHVLIAKRWVLAVLRDKIFFSLDELNEEAARLRQIFNNKIMQKIHQSRWQLFHEVDKPNALPLPAQGYGNTRWKINVRLHIDYHFEIEKYFYSAPYGLRGQLLNVKISEGLIEAFHNNERVACHKRLKGRDRFSTNPEHMPESHKKYVEWNSDRILYWAAKVGPYTRSLAKALLEQKAHPRQAYRAILGIINLNKQYPTTRIEKAAERSLYYRQYSYASLKRILETKLDTKALPPKAKTLKPELPSHENIRGREYYQQ